MSLFVASRLYNLPPEEAKLIQDYLDRVRSYVSRHVLSSELIEDLEGNLAEKLDAILAQSSHTIKDILWAIESLGEPEEVFAFEDAARTRETPPMPGAKELLRGFFARPWRKDRVNGELFGVCAGIAKELEVNPLWVRIAFIVLTFVSGFGILLYLLLILLMEKDPIFQSAEMKQAPDTIISSISSTAAGWTPDQATIQRLPSRAWEFIVLCVNLVMGIWALIASFGVAVLLGWIHSNLSFSNIDFSNSIPQTGYIAAAVGLLTLFTLTVCLLGRAAGRKTWTILSIGALLAGLLFTVGLTTRAVTEGISWFNTQSSRQTTQTLTGITNGAYQAVYLHPNGFMLDDPSITIESSTNVATGSILIKNTIDGWGSDVQTVKQSLEQFLPTEGRMRGDTLFLQRASSNYFASKSPYIFTREHITIIVPAGITVTSEEYRETQRIRGYRAAKDEMDNDSSLEPEITVQPPVTPTVPTVPILSGSTQR